MWQTCFSFQHTLNESNEYKQKHSIGLFYLSLHVRFDCVLLIIKSCYRDFFLNYRLINKVERLFFLSSCSYHFEKDVILIKQPTKWIVSVILLLLTTLLSRRQQKKLKTFLFIFLIVVFLMRRKINNRTNSFKWFTQRERRKIIN